LKSGLNMETEIHWN